MKNQQKGNIARREEAMKLWEPRRAEMWALYANGPISQQEMATRYTVTLGAFQRTFITRLANKGVGVRVLAA